MRQVSAKEFKSAALNKIKHPTEITSWDKPVLVVCPVNHWRAMQEQAEQQATDNNRLLSINRTQTEEIIAVVHLVNAANETKTRAVTISLACAAFAIATAIVQVATFLF